MTKILLVLKLNRVLPVVLITLLLGGCGGFSAGDIQFEGKIFDAVGLNGANARREEPKLKKRAPIVLPPDAKLPEPGKRVVTGRDEQWPLDPELTAKEIATAKKIERQKYCSEVGRNEFDPNYDEDKAAECGTLFGNVINQGFNKP